MHNGKRFGEAKEKTKRTAQKKIDKVCLVNALLLLGLRLEQRK